MKKHPVRKHFVRTGRAVKTIATLNKGPWRWVVGVRAGLAMGLPVAIFTFAGNQSLGMMASLGGFTALYCAALTPLERARILPFVAAGLVVSSTIGVLCSANEWLAIASLIFVSAVACILTIGTRLGPPGPIMFVLVAAVSGHLAAPKSIGGVGVSYVVVPLLVAIGAFLAYLVTITPLVLPKNRRSSSVGVRKKNWSPQFDRTTATISIRVVAGVAVAGFAGHSFGAYRSYWVIIAVIAILQAGHGRRLSAVRGVQRVLGTILGVLVFELIAFANPTGIWIVLIIMLLQFATEVVVTRNYVLALIFITPLALSNSTIGHMGNAGVTIEGRIFDTLLGAFIAMVVFYTVEGIQILRNHQEVAKTE